MDGPVLADVPAASLSDDAPLYDRPCTRHPPRSKSPNHSPRPRWTSAPPTCSALLRSPRWVYGQYDHQLFFNTVVRVRAPTPPAIAPRRPRACRRRTAAWPSTTDSNPRWCALDPRAGTALILAEGVANLACVGATPVAVVNCLNFGNPEHPEVMWQLSECIDGMAEGCTALSLPVIGGNVSLYNESGGADIDPTPVLGVLGLADAVHARPPGLGWSDGDTVMLLGARAGRAPPAARQRVSFRSRVRAGPPRGAATARAWATFLPWTSCAHSVALCVRGRPGRRAGGGARRSPAQRRASRRRLGACGPRRLGGRSQAVAVAEMAAEGGVGCALDLDDPAELFSELPSRILVATTDPDALALRAAAAGIPCHGPRAGWRGPRASGQPRRPPRRNRSCAGHTRATWRIGPGRIVMTAGLCDNGGRVMGVKEACGVFGVYRARVARWPT